MTSQVDVTARKISGTGGARAVRREGLVPGIIYGGTKTPQMCAIDEIFLRKEMHYQGFFTKVYTLSLDGAKEQVMAKDLQLHPVTDLPLHIDFIRVTKNMTVHVAIPVHYINEDQAPGLKNGGSLTILVREIEVAAPVNAIPAEFIVDLTGLEIHDSVHIDVIQLSGGVVISHPERDYTLATISAPTVEVEEEPAGEEAVAEEAAAEETAAGEEASE